MPGPCRTIQLVVSNLLLSQNYIKKQLNQSQKTPDFCVADFATLSDERKSRSKISLLFDMDKRTLRSKI